MSDDIKAIDRETVLSQRIKAVALTPIGSYSLPNGNLLTGTELIGVFSDALQRVPGIGPYCTGYEAPLPCKRIGQPFPEICPGVEVISSAKVFGLSPIDAEVLLRQGFIEETQLSAYQRTEIQNIRNKGNI